MNAPASVRPPVPRGVLIGSALWAILIMVGLVSMGVYANGAGAEGKAPPSWPAEARALGLEAGGLDPVGVLFLHPHCVCSRASLHELELLMAEVETPMEWRAVLFRPGREAPDWSEGSLADQARALPGVVLVDDVDGELARTFGSLTSGSLRLYDADGSLLYSGGITGARGHVGANRGRDLASHSLTNLQPVDATAPVFGCPILTP